MGAMKEPAVSLYQADFHAWAYEQAATLKRGDLEQLDLVNLIEELESLGRSQQQQLENRLAQLLLHLLKWEYPSSKRTKSWSRSIREQRLRIEKLLADMPSLRPKVAEGVGESYRDALVMFDRETGLDIDDLPQACPYTPEQVMQTDWLPSDGEGPRRAGLFGG